MSLLHGNSFKPKGGTAFGFWTAQACSCSHQDPARLTHTTDVCCIHLHSVVNICYVMCSHHSLSRSMCFSTYVTQLSLASLIRTSETEHENGAMNISISTNLTKLAAYRKLVTLTPSSNARAVRVHYCWTFLQGNLRSQHETQTYT